MGGTKRVFFPTETGQRSDRGEGERGEEECKLLSGSGTWPPKIRWRGYRFQASSEGKHRPPGAWFSFLLLGPHSGVDAPRSGGDHLIGF